MSSLALASAAVETISRGAPGKNNIKPNAINVTRRAIQEGSNKTVDFAAQLIRERLRTTTDMSKKDAYADALAIVLALRYDNESGPTAA